MKRALATVGVLILVIGTGCNENDEPVSCIPDGARLRSGRWEGVVMVQDVSPAGCFVFEAGAEYPLGFGICDGGDGEPIGDDPGCSCRVEGDTVTGDCVSSFSSEGCRSTISQHFVSKYVDEEHLTWETTVVTEYSGTECPQRCEVRSLATIEWVSNECDEEGNAVSSVIAGLLPPDVLQRVSKGKR
jgi:hypothetical protein